MGLTLNARAHGRKAACFPSKLRLRPSGYKQENLARRWTNCKRTREDILYV